MEIVSNFEVYQDLDVADNSINSMEDLKNINFNILNGCFNMEPTCKYRLSVPLCYLKCLPLVKPVLEADVKLFKIGFVNDYREGDKVLYVSIVDNLGKVEDVTTKTYESQDENWQVINDSFE